MTAKELELLPLLVPNYFQEQAPLRSERHLPEKNDAIQRLFYLTTFDQPVGKSALRKHQVHHFQKVDKGNVEESKMCEPNYKVLSLTGVVALVTGVFGFKVLSSHPVNHWAAGILLTISGCAALLGAAHFVPWRACFPKKKVEEEVQEQFKALTDHLKAMNGKEPGKASFIAKHLDVDSLQRQLEFDKVDSHLIGIICRDLRSAKEAILAQSH